MPRDQETTSVDQAPSTSRYPFGSRGDGPDEVAPVDDTTVADRDAARTDTVGTEAARTETVGTDAAGMGAVGADTTARDRGFADGTPGTGEGSVPSPEGEWVAGSRGASETAPSQPGQPAAQDIRATGTTPAVAADIDPYRATPPDMDADASPTTGTAPETATAPVTGTTPGADTARLDQPATGAHAAPTAAAPGSAGAGVGLDVAGAAFITDADGYRASWVRIQSGFVDDPHGSVTEAAELITQITGSLVSAVQERERSLRAGWDSGDADTEILRNALRDYRAFFERLTKV